MESIVMKIKKLCCFKKEMTLSLQKMLMYKQKKKHKIKLLVEEKIFNKRLILQINIRRSMSIHMIFLIANFQKNLI